MLRTRLSFGRIVIASTAFLSSVNFILVSSVNQPNLYPESPTLFGRNICLIVGLACLLGFSVSMLVISMPPDLFSLEWRVNLCQQLGDRSILFLAGVALLLYGISAERELTRKLSRTCLIVGVIYIMSTIVVIHDGISLRDQTFRDLASQKRELQTSIKDSQSSGQLPPDISSREVQQAAETIDERAEVLRRDAGRDILKVAVASVGNLLAVGVGLVGLSRVGLRRLLRY